MMESAEIYNVSYENGDTERWVAYIKSETELSIEGRDGGDGRAAWYGENMAYQHTYVEVTNQKIPQGIMEELKQAGNNFYSVLDKHGLWYSVEVDEDDW